jgi:hypothetical protein
MEAKTIPLKVAVGMWTVNFQDMHEEIKTVVETPVSKKQYSRFVNRIKKQPLSAFGTMIITNEGIDRRDFDVGVEKADGKWVVNTEKFLIALNQKRMVHKEGLVEDRFERMLQHLGWDQNLCSGDVNIPDKHPYVLPSWDS